MRNHLHFEETLVEQLPHFCYSQASQESGVFTDREKNQDPWFHSGRQGECADNRCAEITMPEPLAGLAT